MMDGVKNREILGLQDVTVEGRLFSLLTILVYL